MGRRRTIATKDEEERLLKKREWRIEGSMSAVIDRRYRRRSERYGIR
jgi:hypothetical protein